MRSDSRPIWGYQSQFRRIQKEAARELLARLDDRLEPEVFLVGILDSDKPEAPRACVDPSGDFWISRDAFAHTRNLAATIMPTYSEARLTRMHAGTAQKKDETLYRRSIRDAVLLTLHQNNQDMAPAYFFSSFPERMGEYLMCTVLSLPRESLAKHRRFHRTNAQMQMYRGESAALSLVDSAVDEFLSDAADQLRKPEPGRFHDRRDTEELLRAAGRRFATDIAFRADPSAAEGFQGFFSACCIISSMQYERISGHGRMVVARRDHPALRPAIRFVNDARLDQFRGVRKMLELASNSLSLHSNSRTVFGLVEKKQEEAEAEDLFDIVFLGHDHWELSCNGRALMRVMYGQPYLPRRTEYEARLAWDMPRMLPGAGKEEVALFAALVRAVEETRHGTMLVISADAKGEARRLASQCTMVEPVRLTPALVPSLTSIDGAVLADTRGFCHAVGVILDGVAAGRGDSTRGARFNSALRYVASSRAPCMAVVVSEDGGVDVLPNMAQPMKRASIDAVMKDLASCTSENAVPRRKYFESIEWLSAHRFYLLEKDCREINEIMQLIERRLNEEDPAAIHISRQPFKPDPEMSEKLYYEENLEFKP